MDIVIRSFARENLPSTDITSLGILQQENYEEHFKLPRHSLERYEKALRRPETGGEKQLYFLAKKEENIFGYGLIDYRESEFNDISYATAHIFVTKRFRNHKIGKKLLISTLENVPKFIDTIAFEIRSNMKKISYLKENLNANLAYTIRHSVSNIRDFNRVDIEDLISRREKEAKKNGYIIKYAQGNEFEPIAESFSQSMEVIWNQIPRFGSNKNDEEFPAERVLGRIAYFHEHDGVLHVFMALDSKKNIIGFTEVVIYRTSPIAFQILTGVLPNHRGHGLGYLLKLKMLEFLLNTTKVTLWFTGNAYGNEHMLKINEMLKFKDWVDHETWEVKRNDWEKYLTNSRI